MIRIVDYGVGNILAFLNMYKRMNVAADVARTPTEVRDASRLILPGVGAFDHAMALLNASGMRDALEEAAHVRKVPVLGVCVGMQMLARGSSEGQEAGLGWVAGDVRAFKALQQPDLLLPHMGWNDVRPRHGGGLFAGLESDARFYFLHSYYFACDREEDIAATCTYGIEFACAVQAGNILGVQCHPEKSHHYGTQLLKNFAEL